MYIFEQRLSDPSVCDINELRSCVQLLTNKGPLNPVEVAIHFTTRFGNAIDLAKQLPSESCYAQGALCLGLFHLVRKCRIFESDIANLIRIFGVSLVKYSKSLAFDHKKLTSSGNSLEQI